MSGKTIRICLADGEPTGQTYRQWQDAKLVGVAALDDTGFDDDDG